MAQRGQPDTSDPNWIADALFPPEERTKAQYDADMAVMLAEKEQAAQKAKASEDRAKAIQETIGASVSSGLENLRDRFAMAALPAIVTDGGASWAYTTVAIKAYALADAMLEARKPKDGIIAKAKS